MPLPWTDDADLFQIARQELFTAVVSDILDKVGFANQFLPPRIKPLMPDMVLIGRAMTVLVADFGEEVTEGSHNPVAAMPFGLLLEALDDLKPNEIYCTAGGSPAYALWGELMTTRAKKCGAVGTVLEGYTRDTRAVLQLDYPVFCYGSYSPDQGPRGKVIDFRVPVRIGQTRIVPGDILFGDLDGVCVVPREAEEEVFVKALEKARTERSVLKSLQGGMTAVDAFKTYGIL
jgi:regulator of RNase E activity RraA